MVRKQMRRNLMTAVILLLVMVCFCAQAAQSFPFTTVTTVSVNMRRTASSTGTVLDRLKEGESVTVTGESGNYYKVSYGNRTGYILKTYLSTDPAVIQTPVPTEQPTASSYPYETVATEKVNLASQNKALKKKVYGGERMVGESEAICHVREMIEKVAPTPARVLITGGNGSGNGHEKGSFTSAIKQHKGKFEQADGGTLFLDEIGDMSLAAQAKVLRVLQENKLSRVGSDTDIKVDVRVIAATNKDLRAEIEKGTFREDLYHRLSVIVIKVPSLDERKEDIPLLVDYFVERICTETAMPRKTFSPQAVKMLQERSWKGNIRELRNVVERLLILGDPEISAANVRDYVL